MSCFTQARRNHSVYISSFPIQGTPVVAFSIKKIQERALADFLILMISRSILLLVLLQVLILAHY